MKRAVTDRAVGIGLTALFSPAGPLVVQRDKHFGTVTKYLLLSPSPVFCSQTLETF